MEFIRRRERAVQPQTGRFAGVAAHTTGGRRPEMNEIKKRIRNKTKQTCAIQAAVPATPLKPRAAAMTAMIRNVTV
jgi:hypothetical protein